jgi:hypothetical protein
MVMEEENQPVGWFDIGQEDEMQRYAMSTLILAKCIDKCNRYDPKGLQGRRRNL